MWKKVYDIEMNKMCFSINYQWTQIDEIHLTEIDEEN